MNFDGKGEFTFKNGDWFKGEIKNGEFHTGKGKKWIRVIDLGLLK